MSTMKATPGPWRVDGRFVLTDHRRTLSICECPRGGIRHSRVDEANALLIAAAPELLEACHAICRAFSITRESDEAELGVINAAYDKCRAAIAKAEGQ